MEIVVDRMPIERQRNRVNENAEDYEGREDAIHTNFVEQLMYFCVAIPNAREYYQIT